MRRTKTLVGFEISNEIQCFISDEKAEKLATHINFNAIAQLRKKGKKVVAALMKNHLVAYIIQSPLMQYFESSDITHELFAAGLEYSKDYRTRFANAISQPIFDGSFISSAKPTSKDPKQKRVDAGKRITYVNDELRKKGEFIQRTKNFKEFKHLKVSVMGNKRYQEILELFLVKEVGIAEIKDYMRLGHNTIKVRIIEALHIVKDVYKDVYAELN